MKGLLVWRDRKDYYLNTLQVLTRARRAGWQLAWVTLTSVPETRDLMGCHRELMRLVRGKLRVDVEWVGVRTSEGNGVLHQVWMVRQAGYLFMPMLWFRACWKHLSGATEVDFQVIGPTSEDVIKVTRYMVGQGRIVRKFASKGVASAFGGEEFEGASAAVS